MKFLLKTDYTMNTDNSGLVNLPSSLILNLDIVIEVHGKD